jgi:hypothetical protein
VRRSLERHGSSLNRVVSCLVFLADIRHREAFNAVYQHDFAQGRFPARGASGTSGLDGGARVEILLHRRRPLTHAPAAAGVVTDGVQGRSYAAPSPVTERYRSGDVSGQAR